MYFLYFLRILEKTSFENILSLCCNIVDCCNNKVFYPINLILFHLYTLKLLILPIICPTLYMCKLNVYHTISVPDEYLCMPLSKKR